jgi:arginase
MWIALPPVESVAVTGSALDLGAGRRGVDMGPSANRYAGLAGRTATLGREVIDLVEADWLKPFAELSACVGHLAGA